MTKILMIICLLISGYITAQESTSLSYVKGTVTDGETGEALPFVRLIAKTQTDSIIGYAQTDFDGKYSIRVSNDTFSIEATYLAYETTRVEGIYVPTGTTKIVNITLSETSQTLDCVMVTYNVPLMDKSASATRVTISKQSNRRSRRRDKGYNPQVSNTESYSKIESNKFRKVKSDPLSTFSIDVDRAAYSNVRRFISSGNLPPKDAVRIEEMLNYFSYSYPEPETSDPFSISTAYTECAWNKKHKLVQIGLKGKSMEMENAPANNLIFLIDVSGSMQSPDKLELLKSGFDLLIDQLRPKDKVALVVYAGAAGVVLEPTKGNKKEVIKEALQGLEAGGSTAGGEGIELAYKVAKQNFIPNGNNRVILATDGDFNIGISSESELEKLIERKRDDNIFLSVLGFGSGNLQDSKMEKLADKGNGNYAYIDNIFEAKKVLVTEIGGTLFTIAKDVKIQVEFNPKHIKGYRLIGYENRMLDNEDFNDDKKDAGELGSGHTVTALYEIIPAGSKEKVETVDPLKYQTAVESDENVNEVITVKLRYKEPKGIKSKLITSVVYDRAFTPLKEASENIRFASAIAQFGMLLRDSEFKGDSNYDDLISLAKNARGDDDEGYRAEFIKLAKMAQDLAN